MSTQEKFLVRLKPVPTLKATLTEGIPGPPGPVGPVGPPGPEGPVGPEGPSGFSSTALDYSFNASLTTPPGGGQVRLDNSDQTLATLLRASYMTAPGADAGLVLLAIRPGDTLILQDKNDSSRYQEYLAAGDPLDNGTWVEIPVEWQAGGNALQAQRAYLFIRSIGPVGPPGPIGPPGPKGDPGDPATNLISSVFGRVGTISAQAGDYTAAMVSAVPLTRSVIAGAGLTGGGPLSADVTLSANVGAIQTPWKQDIQAANFSLWDANYIVSKNIVASNPGGVAQIRIDRPASQSTELLAIRNAAGQTRGYYTQWAEDSGGWHVTDGVATSVLQTYGGRGVLGTTTAHPVDLVSNNASRIRLDASGNVGIGTSSPQYKLDVAGDINATGTIWSGSGSASGGIKIGSNGLVIQQNPSFPFQLLITTHLSTSPGVVAGFGGSADGTITGLFRSPSASGVPLVARGIASQAGDLFQVQASSGVLQFGVAANGNVGIGTSGPAYKLDVAGDINLTGAIYKSGAVWNPQTPWAQNVDAAGFKLSKASELNIETAAGTYAQLVFTNPIGTRRWMIAKNTDAESSGNAGSNFDIYRYNDAGGFLDTAVRINRANGNVGIGTSGPTYKLDVAGDCNITGVYRINGAVWNPQTPWTANVNAGGFALSNASTITSNTIYGTTAVISPNSVQAAQSGKGFVMLVASATDYSGFISWYRANPSQRLGLLGGDLANVILSLENSANFIVNGGNAGIGVSPAYKLDVAGDINYTGTLRKNGTPVSTGSGAGAVSMTVAAFDAETANGTTNPNGRGLVYLSDGIYHCLWNGSAWEYYSHNRRMIRPPAAGTFTAINQGTATFTNQYGGLFLADTASGNNVRLLVKATPATPYNVTVAFLMSAKAGSNPTAGILLRESGTGKFVLLGLGFVNVSPDLSVIYMNSPTSYGSTPYDAGGGHHLPTGVLSLIWLRLRDDGTNITAYVSSDGYDFSVGVWAASRTAFMAGGPNQYGVFIDPQSGVRMTMLVSHLEVS